MPQEYSLAACARLLATLGTALILVVIASAQEKERIIYSPSGPQDVAPIIGAADAAGNLYGATAFGGSAFAGTIFKLSPSGSGWVETDLYTFQDIPDGFNPRVGVIRDQAGNLYGTTFFGGAYNNSQCIHNCGTVYELSPNPDGSWKETVIYNFTGGADGSNPQGGVTLDAAGNLYGTTSAGGYHRRGTAFKLTPSGGGWSYTRIFTFGDRGSGDQGGYSPSASVTLDRAGNVYGTTPLGGHFGEGVVYRLTPRPSGDWHETVLHQFGITKKDGTGPFGGVILDAAGNVYGGTGAGGGPCFINTGCGTVYKLTNSHGKWTKTTLYNFAGPPDGWAVDSALTFDNEGNLYGVAGGGTGVGVVFKLTLTGNGWRESVLHNFGGSPDGYQPIGGVIFGKGGNLYGGTQYGGDLACAIGCGTVFEVKP